MTPSEPVPQGPPAPAGPPAIPWLAGWRRVFLFLALTVGLLAWFFVQESSSYYVAIPMQSAEEQTPHLFYSVDDNDRGVNMTAQTLRAGDRLMPVIFPVRGPQLKRMRFDPIQRRGEVAIGTASLRCRADVWLGRDVSYRLFPPTEMQLASNFVEYEAKGDKARLVSLQDANVAILVITLPEAVPLGFSAAAFWRNFPAVALGWSALVCVVSFVSMRLFRVRRVRAVWSFLVAFLLDGRPAAPEPVPRLERWVVGIAFAVSLIVQINAVLHHGMMGQDFSDNFNGAVNMALAPEQRWRMAPVDPPLYTFINAGIILLTGNIHSALVCGLFYAFLNLAALWMFYRLARHYISHPVWRMTLMVLVAFLPLRLIHSVVISSDALTQLPFFALAWALIGLTDAASSPGRRRRLAVGASLLLAFGVVSKFTFMSAMLAVLLTLAQLALRRSVRWQEAGILAALALWLPLGMVEVNRVMHPDMTASLRISLDHLNERLSVRDIVFFRHADPHILRAPPYDEPREVERRALYNGKPLRPSLPFELLDDHRYSVLALNHLATFTDSMNIFQYDPTDAYFGQRSARNQRLMALAVKTSLPITLACVLCMVLLYALGLPAGLLHSARFRPDLESTMLLAIGWFSNIVVFLPLIELAYIGGYWTPRLTMPALLVFGLLTVYTLERLLPGARARTAAAWLALGYATAESALQISFLWPWGNL